LGIGIAASSQIFLSHKIENLPEKTTAELSNLGNLPDGKLRVLETNPIQVWATQIGWGFRPLHPSAETDAMADAVLDAVSIVFHYRGQTRCDNKGRHFSRL
jgi:hypothetical protein